MAVAVPVDALNGAPPAELVTILARADSIFDAAQAGNWTKAGTALAALTAAWHSFAGGTHPPLLETQMSGAVAALTSAVNAQQTANARQRAIGVASPAHDFRLRHVTPAAIDLAGLELWARQVQVDAAAGHAAGVSGDAATVEWVRDRVVQSLSAADRAQLNSLVSQLRSAANAHNYSAATLAATGLRTLIAEL